MSSSWIEVAPAIVNTVIALQPMRILDLGMGAGKYGFLIREQADFANGRPARSQWRLRIEGVEGYAPTVQDHHRSVYDAIHIIEVLEFLRSYHGPRFDVCLVIDIIEHFEVRRGVDLIQRALDHAVYVLISTPRGYFQQDDLGNDLQRHLSWWPTKALKVLARQCRASISIGHVFMSNVALLSRDRDPPRIKQGRLRSALRVVRDLCVPERLYYKAIGGTGPSIFEE